MSSTALYDVAHKKSYSNIRVNNLTIDGEMKPAANAAIYQATIEGTLPIDQTNTIDIEYRISNGVVSLSIPDIVVTDANANANGFIRLIGCPAALYPKAQMDHVVIIQDGDGSRTVGKLTHFVNGEMSLFAGVGNADGFTKVGNSMGSVGYSSISYLGPDVV